MTPAIVTTAAELRQIIALQKQNLAAAITPEEAASQGFVTVVHSRQQLQKMHQLAPSVIAKDNDVLAGYALVMTKECATLIPVLIPMFTSFKTIQYLGKPVADYHYYVMGQICVAKKYRGLGVFDMLYAMHKTLFKNQYDFVITEVATANLRSIKAHSRVGFKIIHTFKHLTTEWCILLWNWQSSSPKCF